MLTASSSLLRTGLALKLNQVKLATRSYLRDRTGQATGTATSYAVAAGLFVACGIFLIGASLVGADALFRWVEIKYGLFPAFGAVAALLVVLAAICAGLADARLKRRPPHFPTLSSRLRVAIKANPVKPDQIEAVRDTAAAILMAPSAPMPSTRRRQLGASRRQVRGSRTEVGAGILLVATLLGWAATRRGHPVRRMDA